MRRGLSVPDQLPAWLSLPFAALVLAIDYSMRAPAIDMPGLYLLPVIYAAWYGGLKWGLALSLLPIGRMLNIWIMGAGDAVYPALLASVPRAVAFMAIATWIARVAASQRALKQEVALLAGLLPICAHCKKIRDDGGKWQPIEKYIQERSDATFTHGVCDSCMREHFGDDAGSAPLRRAK